MSLDYDLRKVKDSEKIDRNYLFPVCSVMMALGIDELTEEKLKEFKHRLKLQEAIGGFYYSIEDEKGNKISAFTDEVLEEFKGIRTNVSWESWPKFCQKLKRREED